MGRFEALRQLRAFPRAKRQEGIKRVAFALVFCAKLRALGPERS